MATRAEWAERVERWERSGLSAEQFGRREGTSPCSFTGGAGSCGLTAPHSRRAGPWRREVEIGEA
ncbi:IS66 family insertion sequence element accessory protein TnpA [Sorangium sp. So ce176]|uniref:IS66 family insertion sequence element accessory protein TnpA n=1 Tax=Sorangium sp. So ce176 TaxID=3133286 RepID=UPI003F61E2C8